MPKLTQKLPAYRHHKASGQAVVTINGQDHYPGPWKTFVSRKRHPEVVKGDRYDVASYRRAIARACRQADADAHEADPGVKPDVVIVPQWHPHQLRHNAATFLRKEFGLEVARVVLGHGSPAITETYAELDHAKAVDAIGRVG